MDSLHWMEEWSRDYLESGVTNEMRTMNLIREAAGDMIPWLKFTHDLPEMHETKKVPMLDIQVWIDHSQRTGITPEETSCHGTSLKSPATPPESCKRLLHMDGGPRLL